MPKKMTVPEMRKKIKDLTSELGSVKAERDALKALVYTGKQAAEKAEEARSLLERRLKDCREYANGGVDMVESRCEVKYPQPVTAKCYTCGHGDQGEYEMCEGERMLRMLQERFVEIVLRSTL